ncbi:MAG: polysaccharide biosynthesis tyrosine autokinase, partial [bacterium]
LRTEAISNLETKARSTEQELARLLTQFGENWPEVVRTRNDLETVKRQLQDEKIAAIDRARREVRLRLDTALSSYQVLSSKLREQERLVYKLNEATILYNSLQRDLDASEQLYQGLVQRLKETSISPGLEFGNIHITDDAKANRIPYQPKPLWNISLALILGVSAGTALAFLLDYLDTSARGPADLELMGIPVLGWIPDFPSLQSGARASLETKGRGMSGSTLQLKSSGSDLVVSAATVGMKDPRTREVYRTLCASLLLSKAEKPAKTILVTSAVPKEGKTTTIANIGVEMAETGAPTLLIDADFRNPSLSRRFGEENGKGLSVHLAGGEIDIRQTDLPNLYILPAGPAPPNPVALFTAGRFSDTLALLSQRFQFILIDSPPVLSVAESSILASKVDGIIFVVRAAKTPSEIIARANLQLKRAGACILGAAINRLDLRDPEYSFFSKYYYDQRYYGKEPAEKRSSAG